ncbi:hypothetical protein OE88DRAFT_1657227 [Heliocybe sulcata]|uniref:Uncharacterized protein n=1 Tax=Heliocybe sulcata TaxID=5364 RepID=A0A5C3N5M6_9AGAM|nr:hypothetical protein OE88DRAFT_1657227 [Heliocybe sulcata]
MVSIRILQSAFLALAYATVATAAPTATTSCVPCPTKGPCPELCVVVPVSGN